MTLTLHPVPGKAKSQMLCEAFAAGAPKDAVGHVFAGVTDGNLQTWKQVKGREPYFLVDNSYFDKVRGTQFRVTANNAQHNGRGVTDCKRFDAMGIPIAPWRKPQGLRVLLVTQSELFMRVMTKNSQWLHEQGGKVLETLPYTEFKGRAWNRNKAEASSTLQQDLATTDLVVTHSSAAAVEAVLAGICVRTSQFSAAWMYSFQMEAILKAKAFSALDSLIPDRRHWAGVLADNQFSTSELRDGTAWAMLNKK